MEVRRGESWELGNERGSKVGREEEREESDLLRESRLLNSTLA